MLLSTRNDEGPNGGGHMLCGDAAVVDVGSAAFCWLDSHVDYTPLCGLALDDRLLALARDYIYGMLSHLACDAGLAPSFLLTRVGHRR